MKNLILLALILLVLSCVPQNSKYNDATNKEKVILTDDQEYLHTEFKKSYMMYCLNYGYNSKRDRNFLANDASFAGDLPLWTTGMKVVDSLARVQMDKIKQDSIYLSNEIRVGYVLGQKRVLKICLEGYDSYMIDSMATVWALKLTRSK